MNFIDTLKSVELVLASGDVPLVVGESGVLVMPVYTIASESAFSTGGHTLDSFRSSLTPKVNDELVYFFILL